MIVSHAKAQRTQRKDFVGFKRLPKLIRLGKENGKDFENLHSRPSGVGGVSNSAKASEIGV
jgi:hypothetical protein